MNDADRYRLLRGPYKPPRCKIGSKLFCEQRGWVVVKRISCGRIAWPQTIVGGNRTFILCDDLVKAVRCESASAIRYWWGVSSCTVWSWRKVLDVGQYTEGTLRLHRELFSERIPPEVQVEARKKASLPAANAKKAAAKLGKPRPRDVIEAMRRANLGRNLSAEHRRKISEAARARGVRPPKAGRPWNLEEDALLGTMPDEQVAERTGRTLGAVRERRRLLDIDGYYRKRNRKAYRNRKKAPVRGAAK